MTRYFNLKMGSEKVQGHVLAVNPAAPLEKRVQDFLGSADKCALTHQRTERESVEIYALRISYGEYITRKGRDSLGGTIGVPHYVEKGALVIELGVDTKGQIRLHDVPPGTNAYLTEISRTTARRMREGKDSFDLLRAYVVE